MVETYLSETPELLVGGEVRVIEAIEDEVAARGLRPGCRLPTERDLVRTSGQSRTTVRRALEVLEARGRVVRQVGRGTFLAGADLPGAGGPSSLQATSPADIIGARLVLEPVLVSLGATTATPSDLAEIERCVAGGEGAEGYEAFEAWDAAFHRAIVAATHNALLVQIYDMINAARHEQPLWGSLKRRSFSTPRRDEYRRDHREIAARLSERDTRGCADAMRMHLRRVRSHLLEIDGGARDVSGDDGGCPS